MEDILHDLRHNGTTQRFSIDQLKDSLFAGSYMSDSEERFSRRESRRKRKERERRKNQRERKEREDRRDRNQDKGTANQAAANGRRLRTNDEPRSVEDLSTENPKPKFNCKCSDCGDNDTCQTRHKCMVMSKLDDRGDVEVTHSCLDEGLMHFFCTESDRRKGKAYSGFCCETEMCNNVVTGPPLTSTPAVTISNARPFSTSIGGIHPAVFIAVPVALGLILVALIITVIRQRSKSMKQRKRQRRVVKNYLGDNLSAQPLTDDTSIEFEPTTSGSGSGGMPMLIQRTVAKSVTLVDQIGTGKYGNVYKGLYNGSFVAVKVFLSKDHASWDRENEIYTTLLLRHENILGFIASDVASHDSVTQFWLITHYHKNGSLYDYLNAPYKVITVSQALNMLYSACAGLVHLHTEIHGTQAKPAIAHRDIKSKNILVKDDGTCCIADLGLAVTHKSENNELDLGHNNKVGTKRYMAPEVLNETMMCQSFESFKKADVYSFSLVMWETLHCAIRNGQAKKYQLPFGGMVQSDPSFEEMKMVVCNQNRRPIIPFSWTNDLVMDGVSKLLQESWNGNPSRRLPMLRIKKTLKFIYGESTDGKTYV